MSEKCPNCYSNEVNVKSASVSRLLYVVSAIFLLVGISNYKEGFSFVVAAIVIAIILLTGKPKKLPLPKWKTSAMRLTLTLARWA